MFAVGVEAIGDDLCLEGSLMFPGWACPRITDGAEKGILYPKLEDGLTKVESYIRNPQFPPIQGSVYQRKARCLFWRRNLACRDIHPECR